MQLTPRTLFMYGVCPNCSVWRTWVLSNISWKYQMTVCVEISQDCNFYLSDLSSTHVSFPPVVVAAFSLLCSCRSFVLMCKSPLLPPTPGLSTALRPVEKHSQLWAFPSKIWLKLSPGHVAFHWVCDSTSKILIFRDPKIPHPSDTECIGSVLASLS